MAALYARRPACRAHLKRMAGFLQQAVAIFMDPCSRFDRVQGKSTRTAEGWWDVE
jgi:hypothetical protein